MIAATRPTTLAGVLEDKRNLEPFLVSTALATVFGSRDLHDAAAMLDPLGDWRQFQGVVAEAQRRRGKPEAQQGSNIHGAVQRLATGGKDVSRVPADVLGGAEAALAALGTLGLTPVAAEVPA